MWYHKTYVLCWARSWVWTPQELLSNTRALHLWDWRREGKGWKGKGEGELGEKEGPLTSGTGENIEKAGQPGSTIRSLAFLKAHFINCRMRPEHTGSDGVDYREIWREFRWYHDGVGDFIDDHTRSTCWLVHLIPVVVCWLHYYESACHVNHHNSWKQRNACSQFLVTSTSPLRLAFGLNHWVLPSKQWRKERDDVWSCFCESVSCWGR